MRNFGLDLLRFIAIFLVIGRHMKICPSDTNHFVHKITTFWQTGGWIGVDLFFVISGFLIASLLFRESQTHGKIDVKTFLIRRGLKIYPAFYIFLLLTIIARVSYFGFVPIKPLIGELTFTQNYVGSLWGHTWSLAVEEHFYFGIAILFFLLATAKSDSWRNFHYIPHIFAIIAITCLSLRIITSYLLSYNDKWCLFGTHIRIDSLMYGVFLSWLWNFKDISNKLTKMWSYLCILLGILFLMPAFFFQLETKWWIPTFGITLFYFGSGFLILGCLPLKQPKLKVIKAIAVLGSYSYSIYLYHLAMISLGPSALSKILGELSYPLYFIICFFGSFCVGALLSKVIEFPILLWRNRFIPSKIQSLTFK